MVSRYSGYVCTSISYKCCFFNGKSLHAKGWKSRLIYVLGSWYPGLYEHGSKNYSGEFQIKVMLKLLLFLTLLCMSHMFISLMHTYQKDQAPSLQIIFISNHCHLCRREVCHGTGWIHSEEQIAADRNGHKSVESLTPIWTNKVLSGILCPIVNQDSALDVNPDNAFPASEMIPSLYLLLSY